MAAVTSSTSSSLALSGLASGMDWTSIINDLVAAERAPETSMKAQQTALQTKNASYQTIGADLTTLGKDVSTLMNPSFFDNRTASASNSAVASATASAGAPLGHYTFKITQMASEAAWQGAAAAAQPLSATSDVSGVVLGNAGFANPITPGAFTVNGQIVTIASTDTLQSVFDKINTATGGAVTASYHPATDPTSPDEISLNSSSTIVLGSATDTSNFLQIAQLYNNGADSVTSASALGAVNLNNPLSGSNLSTPINDGGSGAGQFLINGVQISFNASTDSVNDVLQRINDSAAGVTATYDAVNGDFQLANKTTGDVGISLQDVTGNFLAATGLLAGTLQRGKNLQYSVNGGGTLTSQSNTIGSTSSGVTGLSVTALGTGSSTISVQSDTSTISSTINSFVTDYNAVQNYIKSQTASTIDSSGNVTPGTLSGDMDVEDIATQLRELTDASPSGLSGLIQSLSDLGITSNGTDNTLAVDSTALNAALATNLDAAKQLFTNSTNGLAANLNNFLTATTGSKGTLATAEANFTKESANITASISTLEQKVGLDTTRLQNEFVNMETAINSINAQKQYLTAFFNTSTTSTTTGTSSSSSS
jgi:flagellar hook-associated protein 2